LLRSAGYRAVGFASAEAFLRLPDSIPTECLILDVQLPGMSGLDLQRQLAASGVRVPIVVLTARPDHEGRLRRCALQQGALAFFGKPFAEMDLLRVVRATCSV
jgi:FixJ family two-component response regulator